MYYLYEDCKYRLGLAKRKMLIGSTSIAFLEEEIANIVNDCYASKIFANEHCAEKSLCTMTKKVPQLFSRFGINEFTLFNGDEKSPTEYRRLYILPALRTGESKRKQ